MTTHVYEITIEVETKLFRQEVRFTTDNMTTALAVRSTRFQNEHGFRFISCRGPINVVKCPAEVWDLIERERAEAERVATGA